MIKFSLKTKKLLRYSFLVICFFSFLFCLPNPLFNEPFSTILNDKEGKLLAAQIADDSQWRFPGIDSIPYKFKKSLLYFEDQYFYLHPGINPVSVIKAVIQNIKSQRIVRGGSTISLQVIRISRKDHPRNLINKIIESILVLRLELGYSKEEILCLYASHAPFGGNLVGIEAASWRYYGRPPNKLSWGESATLAVLPNSPGLIYPGKNHEILIKKRNRLLNKLFTNKIIDKITCELSKLEPIPERILDLPQYAPHLLSRAIKEGHKGKRLTSTIDKKIQLSSIRVVESNYKNLSQNEIQNAAAIVVDIDKGNVLAYVGNTEYGIGDNGNYVDIIMSKRSSGSILKPFLHAAMLQEGKILPNTLLPDIPTQIAGYTPQNFDKQYDGAVHAGNALARSLNIPAIRMLQEYGVEKFYQKLVLLKLTTINKGSNHYGLSLILGGAEVRLWDLVSAYASLARTLTHYTDYNDMYNPSDYHSIFYTENINQLNIEQYKKTSIYDAGSIWLTFEALTQMDRPMEGVEWELFSTSQKIAWKTGTSFGHRDAWAIGISSKYVVGVWVGNADGEGRPGLTGISTAAPIMFDIFRFLPPSKWFNTPYDDLVKQPVCLKSGYKASPFCVDIDTIYISKLGIRSSTCPFHKMVHLNKEETYLVNSQCYKISEMVLKSWFVLPTIMEWYYKSKDPYYKSLPPYFPGCENDEEKNMDIIKFLYPGNLMGNMKKSYLRLYIEIHPKQYIGILMTNI
jgi:penicillin-binding protein 1C